MCEKMIKKERTIYMDQKKKMETEENSGALEAQKQFGYIKKAKEYVQELEKQLGRRPTCCVTTFGCQVNTEHETEKAA